jgi:hypothetical protein
VWHATLNREATHAATASADFSARLWNAITGDELKSFAHKHIVKSVSFSSEGQRLLTGGSEKLLRIFDLGKPEAEPYVMSGSGSQIKTAQFIANDELILSSCAEDKGIRVWDVKSNTVVTTLSTESPVTSIEVSADGKNMTTADGKTVTFWDLQNFSKVKTWTMDYEVESASVSLKHKKVRRRWSGYVGTLARHGNRRRRADEQGSPRTGAHRALCPGPEQLQLWIGGWNDSHLADGRAEGLMKRLNESRIEFDLNYTHVVLDFAFLF